MKKYNQDHFEILRLISKRPGASQRKLAEALGFSLGKLNYSINELHKKGLIKIQNFTKSKNKVNYLYLLTPQGIFSKTKLTINFMKKKMFEYDELKKEISKKSFVHIGNHSHTHEYLVDEDDKNIRSDIVKSIQKEVGRHTNVAIWSAGHRALALMAIAKLEKIKYVIVDIPPALYINFLRMKNYQNLRKKINGF